MKTIFKWWWGMAVIVLMVPCLAFSQSGVRTEQASGISAYVDTTQIDTVSAAKFLSHITITGAVATDTIDVYSGVGSSTLMFRVIIPDSTFTRTLWCGFKVDSMMVDHRGTSRFFYVYRQGY